MEAMVTVSIPLDSKVQGSTVCRAGNLHTVGQGSLSRTPAAACCVCAATHLHVALSCEGSVVVLPAPSFASAAAASRTAACCTFLPPRPRSLSAMLLSSRSTAACAVLLPFCSLCEPPKKPSSARGAVVRTAALLRGFGRHCVSWV